MFRQALEDLGVVFCETGERLAVERDLTFLEGPNELGVGETERAYASVDAEAPEIAVIALLGAAVAERVDACVFDGHLCDAFLAAAVEAVAFYLRKNVLAVLILHCASFDACHIYLLIRKKTALIGIAHCRVEINRAALALLFTTGALGVEVVVAGDPSNDLALFGHAKAL